MDTETALGDTPTKVDVIFLEGETFTVVVGSRLHTFHYERSIKDYYTETVGNPGRCNGRLGSLHPILSRNGQSETLKSGGSSSSTTKGSRDVTSVRWVLSLYRDRRSHVDTVSSDDRRFLI